MAGLETTFIFSVHPSSFSSSKLLSSPNPLPSIKLNSISNSTPPLSLKFPFSPLPLRTITRKLCSQLCSAASAVQEASVEQEEEETEEANPRRKLFVYNLPRPDSVEDVRDLFAECGNVESVEMAKTRFGKQKSYVYVTMASEEEAQLVIDNFDSQEVSGKIMRVEFAKGFENPDPPPPPPHSVEYRVHVANVDYKVRAAHLRKFFSASFYPISARVVFNKNRKTGYGFVGFATKEEAEAAIAALDRQEFMGRQLRLALSDKNIDKSARKNEEQDPSVDQPEES